MIWTEKIQVIHTHSRAGVRVGYWATLGTPCVLVSHIHGRQHASFSKRIWDQYGAKVFGVCENVLQALKQDFKMSPLKMKIIRNPIDFSETPFVENLNSQKKLALLGRFTGPKGERLQQIITKCFEKWLITDPLLHIEIIGGEKKLLSPLVLEFIDELNKAHGPRIEIKEPVSDLKKHLKNYKLVIAAGRIAMEAIGQGIPCISLGEYSLEDLCTVDNYETQIKSNFGDMGPIEVDLKIDYKIFADKVLETFNLIDQSLFLNNRKDLALKVQNDFSISHIGPQILRAYESCIFKKDHPSWVPTLMYHQVLETENNSPHRIFITTENFKMHLKFFKDHGFTTLHYKDLYDFRSGKRPLSEFPQKPLLLTFDDGYQNNLTFALPLLEKYQMKAVIYLLADLKMTTNSWDAGSGAPTEKLLTFEERKKIASSPWIEIGSHGFCHKKLTDMDLKSATAEIINSKKSLENEFSKKIYSYAYTYGIRSSRDVKLTEFAGYEYAVNTDHGGLHHEDDPWSIFRVNIFPEDGSSQLKKKTSSWYRWYYFLKRGK